MAADINCIVLTGNLTRDPELRSTTGGNSVCHLRVASNTRRKVGDEWRDKPNYFDVVVWGGQGENVAKHMTKGRPVGVDGRLEWKEWTDAAGSRHQGTEIVADNVQFLGAAPVSPARKQLEPAAKRPAVQAIVGCSSVVRAAIAAHATRSRGPLARATAMMYTCLS